MSRLAALAVAAYAAVVGSLATPLWDPFLIGRDPDWPRPLALVAVHLAAGAAVARGWALALPVAAGGAVLAIEGSEVDPFAWLLVPLGVVAIGAGWLLARLAGGRPRVPGERPPRATPLAAAALAFAAVPFAWALAVAVDRARAPRLPDAARARLPADGELAGLCVRADDARVAALVRELRERPDHVTAYAFEGAHDEGDETRDATVREIAEEQLDAFTRDDRGCDPATAERLRAALED